MTDYDGLQSRHPFSSGQTTGLRELELRLEAKLAETKAEIIRWTIGAGIFQTALIAALPLKLVH